MGHRKAATTIGTLDTHPNADEVRGILSRLPCITDSELSALATAWHNTTLLAEARRKALEPDSPLVVEVLSWFDTLQELFVDELRGDADYIEIESDVASTGLKAVRDAIAAAYSYPILTAAEHASLMKAWRSVYATDHVIDPDLGSRSDDVTSLLLAIPRLADRCHDARAAAECAAILYAAEAGDEDIRLAARDEAWHATVLTSRRRIWQLVRRSGSEALRHCTTCQTRNRDEDTTRVVALCVDAACGLLVAGSLDEDIVEVLVEPVQCLIPAPRPTASD